MILKKALNKENLSLEEGVFLYKNESTANLSFVANELRKKQIPDNKVTWIIDRNVNITNVCYAGCKFCNFHRKINDTDTYITSIDEYIQKIDETISFGGEQLLLQGGLHPKLGLEFYTNLFSEIKKLYPNLKLHALGPSEVHHIAKMENLSYKETLLALTSSGLDSLPGAGAEILSDRVRTTLSKAKCTTDEWLGVMEEAHKQHITTSATMMFGHIETVEEKIQHLIFLRELQTLKPKTSDGFTAFIPWPFQDYGTELKDKLGVKSTASSDEYVRLIAISRIMLPNIKNIQASWLTVGKETAQVCLHSGANDFGSIMIEENVVSAAGAKNKFDAKGIQKAIIEAGFVPQLRNQKYEYIL